MSTHTPEMDEPEPMSTSEGAAQPRDPEQALRDALDAAEAVLDGPAPQLEGEAACASFRDWIERSTRPRHWAANANVPLIDAWVETKRQVTGLVESLRAISEPAAVSPETMVRFDRTLRALLSFGVLVSLNHVPRDGSDGVRRVPKYALTGKEKHGVLGPVLDGWTVRGSERDPPPGLVRLLLRGPQYARRPRISMDVFFRYIDFYLESQRLGAEATAPTSLVLDSKTPPAIAAEDVSVTFMVRYHKHEATIRDSILGLLRSRARSGPSGGRTEFVALRDLNLVAFPGDVVGVIGKNGSGKTTLLKTLAGILQPDRGRLRVRGKVGCLLSFGVGFNAQLSGRENVFINGSILGLSESEIDEKFDRIVGMAELGEFIDAPVRTYSAGMRGRLGFAIAIHIDPDVLILDEVLTVGDAYFRDKAGSVIDRFRDQNKTIIIASHSMDLIRRACTRALWIEKGCIRMDGQPGDVTRAYVAQCRRERDAASSDD